MQTPKFLISDAKLAACFRQFYCLSDIILKSPLKLVCIIVMTFLWNYRFTFLILIFPGRLPLWNPRPVMRGRLLPFWTQMLDVLV
ncbi:hypothetical protein POUND7_001344 [Theobroma cacao]